MLLPFALLFAAQSVAAPPPASDADAEMIAACNARMVEVPVTLTSKTGGPKQSKVKICGKVGQTDADWANTLKDAIAKVEANVRMAPAIKEQIVSGLKLEIAKLPAAAAAVVAPPAVVPRSEPAPSIVPVATAPLVPNAPATTGPVEYSALPPMPAPLPAVTVASAATAAAPPLLPAPRMTFRCLSANTYGSQSACDLLERDTLMTVLADEDLPSGTSLRFMRRGDNRAEVDLTPLRRGQSQRFALPLRVCQGVTGSRVEIEVVRAAKPSSQVVDTRGPFELRC
jgi:hypothetical protein